MAQATTLSLSKFTSAVQAAVKAAAQRHPKFKIDPPHGITVLYLIRGIPVAEKIAEGATLSETQAFANDVAAHLGSAHPEAVSAAKGSAPQGVVLSVGGHVIIGIPPVTDAVVVEP
jgi:hypothetical protein